VQIALKIKTYILRWTKFEIFRFSLIGATNLTSAKRIPKSEICV